MAYEVIMGLSASYAIVFVGTFTEYPSLADFAYQRHNDGFDNSVVHSMFAMEVQNLIVMFFENIFAIHLLVMRHTVPSISDV